MNKQEWETELAKNKTIWDQYLQKNLKLDMTRGKPSSQQLDLANDMLNLPGLKNYHSNSQTDTRNYGGLDGLPEMKELFAPILDVSADQVLIGGNSSLELMHDSLWRAWSFGLDGGTPWKDVPDASFLCPVPGYDRHFAATEVFGIKMINVSMTPSGPDMDQVEELVKSHENIKGIWIVPKYSNPTGFTCSAETVERLAKMKTKAQDFRIFWDNAYAEHHLGEQQDELANIYDLCQKYGNAERVLIFGSTSKISFAGSGVSAMAASPKNIQEIKKYLQLKTIGPDKINQWRHVQFFKDSTGLRSHMQKHAQILKPKFAKVIEVLEKELGGTGLAQWTNPGGGYFISLDVPTGCAHNIVSLADKCGVKLTNAGATFPYGKDETDTNIRIAPSHPDIVEIEEAINVVCICIKIVSIQKLLSKT